jgi:hypothetical protein
VNLKTFAASKAAIIQTPGTPVAMLSQAARGISDNAPWHSPLFRALVAGEIAMVLPLPGQSLPIKEMSRITKPIVVMLCDDGPYDLGPAGWACADRALRWAKGAMLNGTGGDDRYYQAAVAGALICRTFVIADCSSAHLLEWESLARRHCPNQVLSIRPYPGTVHPTQECVA